MPHGRRDEHLYEALKTFGRRERGLSAANLEHHEDVLVAVFGESVVGDVTRRQHAAVRVEHAMRQVIESFSDLAKRRAAEVVFASDDRFRGLYVRERIAVVESDPGDRAFSEQQYKRLREWVLEHMAAELPHALAAADRVPRDQIMSSAAMRAARQLYRYAQQVIVIVDVFEGCIRYEERLKRGFSIGDISRLQSSWLAAYGMPGEDFRLVPTGRSYDGDQTLLPLAYFQRYRRALLADRTARDYLRENLNAYGWERLQTGHPLSTADIDVLVDTLETTILDEPWSYLEALLLTQAGQVAQANWASLLSTNAYGDDRRERLPHRDFVASDRMELTKQLLQVCMLFEGVFPDDTDSKEEEFLAVGTVLTQALAQAQIELEGDEGFERERRLEDEIRDRRPTRYRFRDDDELVWVEQDDYLVD